MSSSRQIDQPINLNAFLSSHGVFTVDELGRFMSEYGSTNTNTRKALLTYYQSKGRIVPIRRALYATVPISRDPDTYAIDPFLVAAKMVDDAVLAYHTALEFHGKAYSVYNRLAYTSESRSRPMQFRSRKYVRISVPYALRTEGEEMISVEQSSRAGVVVRVTNLERTLVDVPDDEVRPFHLKLGVEADRDVSCSGAFEAHPQKVRVIRPVHGHIDDVRRMRVLAQVDHTVDGPQG